jgi:hypothetical protein
MALHQHTLTVIPDLRAGPLDRYGEATWATTLENPRLIGAVPILPRGGNVTGSRGVDVRARIDGDVITVEVSGDVLGPIDVLLTVEA